MNDAEKARYAAAMAVVDAARVVAAWVKIMGVPQREVADLDAALAALDAIGGA